MKRTNDRYISIKQDNVKKPPKICKVCGKPWTFKLEQWKEDGEDKCRHDDL